MPSVILPCNGINGRIIFVPRQLTERVITKFLIRYNIGCRIAYQRRNADIHDFDIMLIDKIGVAQKIFMMVKVLSRQSIENQYIKN
jgi:hypothetical protein